METDIKYVEFELKLKCLISDFIEEEKIYEDKYLEQIFCRNLIGLGVAHVILHLKIGQAHAYIQNSIDAGVKAAQAVRGEKKVSG